MGGRRRVVVAASSARGASQRGRRTSTKAIVYAIAGLLFLLPGSAVLLFIFEHGHNDSVHNLGDTFRWALLTLLEDQAPFDTKTNPGTVLTYVVLIGALIFIAVATAAVASKLVELVLRQDVRRVRSKVRNHIVICGWSAKGEDILRELHLQETEGKRTVVVLAPLNTSPTDDPIVTFVKGHPTREEDLLRAGLDQAETAIVLADDSNPSANPDDIDARTLLATLAVETVNPDVYSCVEVLRSQNRHHFVRANADELIVSDEMTGALMANSAVTHGLSRVVTDLMTHSEGNEFQEMSPSTDLVGMQLIDAIAALKRSRNCILFAIAEPGQPYDINPPADMLITPTARLLVIAEGAKTP